MISPSRIEQGLLNFAVPILSAEETTFGSGANASVVMAAAFAGTPGTMVALVMAKSNAKPPQEIPAVVFRCTEAPNDVGTLYTAKLIISISSPMRTDGITEDMHRLIVDAIYGLMVPANADALDSALQSAATVGQRGWYDAGPREGIVGERWQCDLIFDLGVEVITS